MNGNDFRDLLSAGIPTPAGVAAASTAIIGEIITGISELSASGLTDYVVFGMPDLSRLPSVVNEPFAEDVRAAVDSYNGALIGALQNFGSATGLNLDFFDVVGLTEDLFDSPDDFGLTFLTEAYLANPVACSENPDQFFFYDDIHPTDAVHELITDAFEETTAIVPLPAGMPLILSAFAVLGLASLRRKSRA